MAGSTVQAFDFARAQTLQTEIKNQINELDQTLGKIQTKVESVREWWKGGSEEKFIQNFTNTKKEIRKGLQKWLEDYEKLMKEVQKVKEEQDKALGNALKN